MTVSEANGTWAQARQLTTPSNTNTSDNYGSPDTINSIGCTSAGNCTGVGSYSDTSDKQQPMVAVETNGTWGQGRELSLPSGATLGWLSAVSCTGPGACTATGFYQDASGNGQAMTVAESGGVWGQVRKLTLPAGASSTNQSPQLDGVSCSAPGDCTAVGGYTANGSTGSVEPMTAVESNGSWAQAKPLGLPSGASGTQYASLESISCPSSSDCTAVGRYDDASGSEAMAATETGGTWAATKVALPAGTDGNLASVSCPSIGNCSAVGSYNGNGGMYSSEAMTATETNGAWAQAQQLSLPANASTASDLQAALDAVTCNAIGECTAVGHYLDGSEGDLAMVVNSTPSSTPPPPSTPSLIGKPTASSSGVSDKLKCTGSSSCKVTETLTSTETTSGGKVIAISARAKRKKRTVTVGAKTVTVSAGGTETVTVKLNGTGNSLLKHFGKLPVSLKVVQSANGKSVTIATRSLTIKAKKKKKKAHKH